MSTLKVSNIQDISNNAAMSISGGNVTTAGNLTTTGNLAVTGNFANINQPSAQLGRNGNITSNGTIIWNIIHHNTGNHYNSSTGKFTCPITGFYFCQIMVMSSSNTNVDISLRKNNADNDILNPYQQATGGLHNQVSGSAIVSASVNDTLEFYLGGGNIYGGSGGRHTSATFHLLG